MYANNLEFFGYQWQTVVNGVVTKVDADYCNEMIDRWPDMSQEEKDSMKAQLYGTDQICP